MKKLAYLLGNLMLLALLSACNNGGKENIDPEEEETGDKDLIENIKFKSVVSIQYNGNSVVINNPLEGNGINSVIDGANLTLYSITSENVEYQLSGQSDNGSFKIYSEHKYKLLLNNLSLQSKDSCVVNLQSSKRCYLVLADGSTNSLTDGTDYFADKEQVSFGEDRKGAVFCEGQLIVSGAGTLNITGRNKHGLASDEYLRIRQGTIHITQALSNGIHVKDYYLQEGGEVQIDGITGKGIKITKGYFDLKDGLLTINTQNDGIYTAYGEDISAAEYDPTIVSDILINGGTLNINCTEDDEYTSKALMSELGNLYLNEGVVNILIEQRSNAYKVVKVYPGNTKLTVTAL